MTKPTYYITTPIYYTSGNLHIGHSYTTVLADSISRYKKLTGYDVMFLTGTDEHGQKVAQKAADAGKEPKQFVDDLVAGIKDLWKLLDIEYDDFIRTTDDRHIAAVKEIFKRLYEKGDIYKGEYEGWYCTPCESYWTLSQLVDGKCPDCGREVHLLKEENYFLRLSKYQDWMIRYIEEHPDFIQPQARANEMLNNFLRPGLEDLAVSRTTFQWGIPVDFDDKHVIYVWVDALTNYITALGYSSADESKLNRFWPADLQLMSKEIVRFHTIIWPIILHILDLPLPKHIYSHGWLTLDGNKMGKSVGNVVDPVVLSARYGVDAVRYFLMREMPFGADGEFSNEALINRINYDLANDLGNLVSRTVAMIERYFDGVLPAYTVEGEPDISLKEHAQTLHQRFAKQMDALQFPAALQEIWQLIGECNKYIDVTTPWILARDEENKGRLGSVLYVLAECIRIISVLISSVMPNTAKEIYRQLGIAGMEDLATWESLVAFGKIPAEIKVVKGEALFPRLDLAKELEALRGYLPPAQGAAPAQTQPQKTAETKKEPAAEIAIEDFAKVQMQTAKVVECVAVKKSDKLLQLSVQIGAQRRTIVSGIAQWYAPADLIGKTLVVVTNLKPVKLRGIVSEGMILTAEDETGRLSVLTVEGEIADGAEVR